MRILVVGGTGFSGPHVVRRLLDMGHEIALFHRGRTEADSPGDVHHIQGDRARLPDYAGELRGFAPEIVLDMIPFTEGDARNLMDLFTGVASGLWIQAGTA
jgi:nucleoside-diphosphate-sugar epimerase